MAVDSTFPELSTSMYQLPKMHVTMHDITLIRASSMEIVQFVEWHLFDQNRKKLRETVVPRSFLSGRYWT